MKKINAKVLEVRFQSLSDFRKEVTHSLKKRETHIQAENQILFDSPASFRKFMTIQKIELLMAISAQNPESIYELANLVDRDFAAVLKDCNSLEGTGFIRLEDQESTRKSKAPILSFPYSAIHVILPTNAYQIKFDLVA